MKVSNEWGVPNQFVIRDDNGVRYFQSYGSIIVREDANSITLDERYWDYSRTTGKYRNKFLGESIKETRVKIANNIYKLANLN
jgi:hypothetical protein